MNLAYLLLTHTSPQQTIRLIESLHEAESTFIVHVDERAGDEVFAPLQAYALEHPYVILAPRFRCYWSGFGIVDATLGCLRTLLRSGRQFDYAALLSGGHYPIKTIPQIHSFLQSNAGSEFMMAFPLDEPNPWTSLRGRFNAAARVQRITFYRGARAIQLPVLRRKMPLAWRPFGGSQWWCLSRGAIEWINAALGDNPGLERFFRHTSVPDEIFFQTILANSPFAGQIRSSETINYVDWERPNPKSPRVLDQEDFSRVKASPALFARKVDQVRSDTLLARIDEELLQGARADR